MQIGKKNADRNSIVDGFCLAVGPNYQPRFAPVCSRYRAWNYKKNFRDCNRTINDFNSTVTVADGPVTV